jgi:teichoic acid transport system ATP-binding protein
LSTLYLNQGKSKKSTKIKPLIHARNLGVYYEGDKNRRDDFKSIVHGMFQSKSKDDIFWALKDVSFKGYAGDVLGVIGSNGAGKTTLCRVISGLLKPNRGKLTIRGNVSSLLSLGAGFNRELSGNDNIFLNGMMLGLSKKRIEQLLPSIQEFSGLGRFLRQPLKHYSSGMKARLGFSVASSLESDILVIDEVLGTGDMEFNERAAEKVRGIVKSAKMVLVVTHNTEFVKKNCNRAIWIDKGVLKASGEANEVVETYKKYAEGKSVIKKRRILSLQQTKDDKGKNKSVEVENLSIKFNVGGKPFWALNDVNFTIYDKEIVGIIGPNGAGKSTLCRALCGIYKGDSGLVHSNGSIAALLSFGTGFNPQLSGHDNIYLNGMMLGIPKRVITKVEDEIIEFSGLEEFIYKPVKQYSKGMRSRLGFSIATMLQPDIFIIDEALSAGDIAFQERATNRMQEMMNEAKSVIVVTHSMKIVEKACTRALYISDGKLVFDGHPKEAVKRYRNTVKSKKRG